MEPNFVAKKSAASVLSFWLILFSWLIIPLIIQIARIVSAKSYSIEFYDNKVIVKSGILTRKESQSVFAGVYSVNISQSLFGRLFNYADLLVDCPGRWDIDTHGIKDFKNLKNYLESRITGSGMTRVVTN